MRKFNNYPRKPVWLLAFMLLMSLGLQQSFAQKTVSGKILAGDNNEALPGVNIVIKGTTTGTVTDIEGEYQIQVPGPDAVLLFSSIGYSAEEVIVGNQSTINLTLEPDITQLGEIVVVGYGSQEKKDVTGSIATVGEKDFENQPVTRFDQILQGRTPGVNVTNSSGAPGGAVSIRIRGANSINGNNEPLYVIDGFVGGNFRDINPSDIESIQVLKDASATAIYGSRGANGVVLVTTKTGTQGEPKLSFTARYMTSEILNTWDLMDAATFAETANQRATALNIPNLPFTDAEIAGFRQNGGTDWQDELLRRAGGQEYQLDYSGGKDNITYFVSGNYLDQEGILINSNFKRYSLRTNVKANLSEKLNANLKMNFVRRETNNTSGNGNTSGPLAGALAWAPTTPARDANGALTVRDPISSIKGNPIELAENDDIDEVNTFNANGGFNYEIIDGLTLDVGFGVSYSNRQTKNYSANSINDNPNASRGSYENVFLQNTNTLNYTKTFNEIHTLTVTGVFEQQLLQSEGFSTTASGLQFPELKYENVTLASSVNSQANQEKQTIRSYIGRINYSLLDRYLITASVRTDGSSKFRGDNKYSTFPSVGLGWRISEEGFMEGSFFDDLKLRASWGETGSQAIPVFGTVTTFYTDDQRAGTSFENGVLTSGIIIGNPGNPNLKWETTEQINVGIDMQVLNGRLGFTADYFQKSTTDLLLSEPLPQYSGGGAIFRNLGEVDNTGFEFGINSTIIDNGSFNWYSSFNASFLTNEVTSIGDREKIFQSGDAGAGLTNLPELVIIPGNPLSNYWGLKYLGVWQADEAAEAASYDNVPGDSKYEDLNGDGSIGGDDYQIIGSGIPTTLMGWNNTVTYKNLTLNVFFQSMMGYDKWNFTYAQAVMANADAREVTHVDIANRWIADVNEDTDIPAFSETDVSEIQSSRFIESGDFIRLKNISLTYNLPKDLIPGIDASFMVGANNLWTITNYKGIDPESYSNVGSGEAIAADAGSYPNAKTWTFGINVTF